MPPSSAACMILTASFSSLTEPMCQPPRHRIDTFSPVLPRGRLARPVLLLSSSSLAAPLLRPTSPRAAPAASDDCRNSRRSLLLLLLLDMLLPPSNPSLRVGR